MSSLGRVLALPLRSQMRYLIEGSLIVSPLISPSDPDRPADMTSSYIGRAHV